MLLDKRQKNKVQNEQCGAYPKDRIDLFDLTLADLNKDVENESCRNTVGNAIAKSHKDTCEECGNCLVELAPVNILEGGRHHNTDNDKCGSCCRCGNSADK